MYVVEKKVEWSINSGTFQWYILYMYNIVHRKKSKYIEIRKSWHKYGLILLLLKCFFKIISAHFFKAFRKSFSSFSGKSSSQIVLYLYLLFFFFSYFGQPGFVNWEYLFKCVRTIITYQRGCILQAGSPQCPKTFVLSLQHKTRYICQQKAF